MTGKGRSSNVAVLGFAQALGFSGASLVTLVGGIVGAGLAPSPDWATLPVTASVVGTALFTIPAAALMKRIGRRLGFVLASGVASLASLAAAAAIAKASFPLFCLFVLVLGGCMAFAQQYRFAAAESVEPRHRGTAVSVVLVGGVAAGFIGTTVARLTRDSLAYGAYTGSFVALAAISAVVLLILLLYREVPREEETAAEAERPLRAVVGQITYVVALCAAVVAYGVMGFIMTATPVSMMVMDHMGLGDAALVIQSHVAAMYVPSLFSGFLIDRLGETRLKLAGIVSMTASVALSLFGHSLGLYLAGLVLVGIGWNFLFVGGTVLLIRSYRPAERFKAQGINDFCVFAVQALVSLLAGSVVLHRGWALLNLVTLPFLAATFALILIARTGSRKPGVAVG